MENTLYQTLSLNQVEVYFPPSWFNCCVQLMTIITPYCNYISSCFTLKVCWALWRNNLSTSASPSLIPTPMQYQELNQNQCNVVWPRDKCMNMCWGRGVKGRYRLKAWAPITIWCSGQYFEFEALFMGFLDTHFQLLFKYNLRENGHFHHYFAQMVSYQMEGS